MSVSLFGRFQVQYNDQTLHRLETAKARELFAVLLVHRDHDLSREILAEMLWSDAAPAQSRKYLRQALWHLQTGLRFHLGEESEKIVTAKGDRVCLNPDASLWVDIREFDASFSLLQGTAGCELTPGQIDSLQRTVDLYQGNLLEGWYQDWCIEERTRLQAMYVTLLEKVMDACEASHQYDLAVDYGERIIRVDAAHERTHQRLMLIHYGAGHRTAALRQYERCVVALRDELGVEPGMSTQQLYAQISSDQLGWPDGPFSTADVVGTASSLQEILGRLRQMDALVSNVQRQLRDDILSVEHALGEVGDSRRCC